MEGDGDAAALPLLLRRYLQEQKQIFDLQPNRPVNAKGRDKLLRPGQLERYVRLASLQEGTYAVLLVCDAERDPACKLGPEVSARAASAVGIPVRACLAVRAYENWLVGSTETIEPAETAPADCEGGSATGIVRRWREPRSYIKPIDQPKLTQRLDFDLAKKRCRSFTRLLRCVDELLELRP